MATEATKIPFVEAAAPATPAAGRVVTYAKSDGLMYSKDDAGTETLMSGTSANPQLTTIELGHASDTTLSRASAGVVAVEGTNLVKAGAATGSGLTMATARLLGRTTASSGAIEEITAGTGLSLSGGSLTATAAAVPGWLSDLAGTTDANNYYWDGNDLAGFTEVDITGTTTWAEGDNLVSCLAAGMTADDANCMLIAKTFSVGDTWELTLMGLMGHSLEGGVVNAAKWGIIFTDGTVAGSNAVAGHYQVSLTTGDLPQSLLVGRHGTLTAMTTAPWVLDDNIGIGPLFFPKIRLLYQAANTFRLTFSPDGVTFHAFGEADISKTMTPTHVGMYVEAVASDGFIFTFGPLKKVA